MTAPDPACNCDIGPDEPDRHQHRTQCALRRRCTSCWYGDCYESGYICRALWCTCACHDQVIDGELWREPAALTDEETTRADT